MLNVRGAEYARVLTTIPDVNPVGVIPTDPDLIRVSAALASLGGGLGFRPFAPPTMPGFTNTPIIANVDAVDHDFLFFLRDDAALNLQLNTVAVTVTAGQALQLTNLSMLLMPGQCLELEMQEVVNTTAPNLTNFYGEYLVQPFDVCGYELGNQADIIDDAPTVSVLTAPANRRRIVLSSPFMRQSEIFNRDTVAHAVAYTHSGGLVVNNDPALAAVGTLPAGGTMILDPAESLTASTATATTTTDLYALWTYADIEA